MDFQKEYLSAIKNKQYDDLLYILSKNLIYNFSYKSVCDFGAMLCDEEKVTITLNDEECKKLGKNLILSSYKAHPDTVNALALQIVCLERDNDYQTVADMSADSINDSAVINNIAYSKYNLKLYSDAYELQNKALELNTEPDKQSILEYNLMLYDLALNNNFSKHYNYKSFLNMLISDDVFDCESAMIMAVIFDDCDFVKKNLGFYRKIFEVDKEINLLLDNYLIKGEKFDVLSLNKMLNPITYYGRNFYLNK